MADGGENGTAATSATAGIRPIQYPLESILNKYLGAMGAILVLSGTTVHAQSSVQIFGTLDMSLRRVSNAAGKQDSLSNNGVSTSKIAFTGEEDLGGGAKAGFWLESQVDGDVGVAGGSNGTTSAFWNRRSTVSVSAAGLGELRLGRDYVPTHSLIAEVDPHNTNGVGNSLNLLNQNSLGSGVVTQVRANNAVSYFLPGKLGGFFGQLMFAPGEGLPGQKYQGGRIGYDDGKLRAQLAYSSTLAGTGVHFKQTAIGASYDFGLAKVAGFVNENKFAQRSALVYLVGATIPVSALGEIRTAYEYRNASGAGTGADDASQFTIAYWHKLSKRTMLYGNWSHLSNKGAAAFVQSGGPAVGTRTGLGSTGYDVGLRHFF
jgi:predicted porin